MPITPVVSPRSSDFHYHQAIEAGDNVQPGSRSDDTATRIFRPAERVGPRSTVEKSIQRANSFWNGEKAGFLRAIFLASSFLYFVVWGEKIAKAWRHFPVPRPHQAILITKQEDYQEYRLRKP